MNAHKVEAMLSQDGQLLLNGLPFLAGDRVEVIVLAQSTPTHNGVGAENQGSAIDVVSPATSISSDQIYLAGVSSLMEEWGSDADEAAYQNL